MHGGRPDAIDRLLQALVLLIGIASLVFGLTMLAQPLAWYAAMPTVVATGPPNLHFIRDVGVAYAACGVLLVYAGVNLALRWGAALTGALWLLFHGLVHVYELAVGLCSPARFWSDAPGVLGPPLLVLAAVAVQLARMRFAPGALPKALFVPAFDRGTGGLSPFIHDLAAAPGFATEKFQHFMPLSFHRHAAAPAPFHAARIAATLVADCGPCAILAGRGARDDGLEVDVVNALLKGNPPAGELSQAFAFGEAVARHDPAADPLGDAIEASQGRAVRLELALTAAVVTTYPALKRGLGYAKSCAAMPPSI